MEQVKVTAKGTELPLLLLKGKPYLQVAHRLVWFREDHPDGQITTELVTHHTDDERFYAIFKATITINDKIVATACKMEAFKHFPDYIEKAETGAIGRALAIAGYGTQFEPELDEGERIVDSPTQVAKKEGNGQ